MKILHIFRTKIIKLEILSQTHVFENSK